LAALQFFDIESKHAKKNQNPVISKSLDKIKNIDHPDFKSASISTLYKIEKANGLERALEKCVQATTKLSKKGITLLSFRTGA
jgi:glutamate synthase (ferredoxin)